MNYDKVLTDAKAAQAKPNPGKWKGAFCDRNKAGMKRYHQIKLT